MRPLTLNVAYLSVIGRCSFPATGAETYTRTGRADLASVNTTFISSPVRYRVVRAALKNCNVQSTDIPSKAFLFSSRDHSYSPSIFSIICLAVSFNAVGKGSGGFGEGDGLRGDGTVT